MTKTEFEQTKQECLKSLVELYRECMLLAHRSVRALDAVNKAQTECELESAEHMVLSLAETFKHIEIMG